MATPDPLKLYKCTYEDCSASFSSVKDMKRHKKYSDEHDYCHKCDEDFQSVDDLSQHKAWRPDQHGKACRICGEEFKTTSGLRRHIQLNHRTNQKILCIGCGEDFYNATQYIDHLEFGHCKVIPPAQFTGHILHKHILFDLLGGGETLDRFLEKVSKFNTLSDDDSDDNDGGVRLDGDDGEILAFNDGNQARQIPYKAMEPELMGEQEDDNTTRCSTAFESLSLSGASESTLKPRGGNSSKTSVDGTERAWTGRSSSKLFPDARPTPLLADFTIQERQLERTHGVNIMKTRFWDPTSKDWSAERFYNPLSKSFSCPFPCEQTFANDKMLADHITGEHRLHRINCARCLKYFDSITALVRHCETPNSRCNVREATDFNMFLDRITGGFLTVEEITRPEFLHNPSVRITDPDTGKRQEYTPPNATMLQFKSAIPPDWNAPRKVAAQIGGGDTNTQGGGQMSFW